MDNNINTEQRKAIEELKNIISGKLAKGLDNTDLDELDEALWRTVVAYQNYELYTKSGLMFSYIIKCKRNGEYSGELIVSPKAQ
jgi:hypothetical protein